jgi:hypothetical protein
VRQPSANDIASRRRAWLRCENGVDAEAGATGEEGSREDVMASDRPNREDASNTATPRFWQHVLELSDFISAVLRVG